MSQETLDKIKEYLDNTYWQETETFSMSTFEDFLETLVINNK